ncbi:MAG TPA: response regulator [Thermoanaerobaculia bacterium]|nr:response regulator [Thermoanaerobaculia bacterium]
MSNGTVYVIDDDRSVCSALRRLLASHGYSVETFLSPSDFLRAYRSPETAACVVLDVGFPGMDGLEFQEQLASVAALPIVFLSGTSDIAKGVRAMKKGAVDFLSKPVAEDVLLPAIEQAIAKDLADRSRREWQQDLRVRWEQLTPREKEVAGLVVSGMLNKQVGLRLHVSEKTVKVHRARVMEKMQADSVADLVRMVDAVGGRGV